MFTLNWLLERLLYVVPLILSLSVHEWAHAYSAYRLGDDTAERQGRMTLNPIVHIDPLGTLLLPLLGVPFGWARPVPVNPVRFRRDVSMRTGMMITASAGPISNVVIAIVAIGLFGILFRIRPEIFAGERNGVFLFFAIVVQMNVALALFNLLPIFPLDGSRVADGLMPHRFRPQWEKFTQYSSFVLFGVIVFGSRILGGPFGYVQDLFFGLMWHAAGIAR